MYSVQLLSRVWLCDPMNCSMPGLPVHHQLLEFNPSSCPSSRCHSWVLFLLWLHPFILSGVISPLISSSILGTYRPGEFLFQYPIILPFHIVHGVLKARILKCFAIPFSSGPHSVRPLHHDPSILGGPTRLRFIELDKAVVRVIRLTSLLWLWLQCVCPLMPSCNTYCLGFLLLWMWDISSPLLQQSAAAAPYLGWGRPSWSWVWSNSSRPSCTCAATAPWTWGCSSRLPPLTSDMG